MFRRIAMLAIVLVVATAAAAPALAQEQEITITTAAANVHKGPSTGSPVIGTVPHGTVLEVTRNLGDWVKVRFPTGTILTPVLPGANRSDEG